MIRQVPPRFGLDLQGAAGGPGLHVLVVETNGYTGGLLQETAARAGIAVDLAREPRSALRRLRDRPYDVILIDLPTPGIADRELFGQIESIDDEQARRVIFLVNDLGDPGTRRFLTEAGRPYLTQPADPADLCDLVIRVGSTSARTNGGEPETRAD